MRASLLLPVAGVILALCGAAAAAADGKPKPGSGVFDTVAPRLPFNAHHPAEVGGIRDVTTAEEVLSLSTTDTHPTVIFIYDSLDLNSARAAPEIVAAAEELKGFVEVVGADVQTPEVAFLLDAWGVQVVPSIKGLSTRKLVRTVLEKTPLANVAGVKQPVDFPRSDMGPGGITAKALKTWALTLLADNAVQRVEAKDVQALQEMLHGGQANAPSVLLVTNKAQTSPLYKAIATRFANRARFFEVNSAKAKKAILAFSVEKVPSLYLYAPDGSRAEFEGAFGMDTLAEFLTSQLGDDAPHRAAAHAAAQAGIDRHAKQALHAALPVTTAEEWRAEVIDGPNLVGVFFVDKDDESAQTYRDTLVRDYKAKYQRSSVGAWIVLDTTQAKPLWDAVSPNGAASTPEERPDLVFVSAKKASYTRFVGSLSVSNLGTFVFGPLSRGTGAKKFAGDNVPLPW